MGGSYAVILLVSPLGSLTIAKFDSVNERCFVVAHFSALYEYYFGYEATRTVVSPDPHPLTRRRRGSGKLASSLALWYWDDPLPTSNTE